jgi:hypothetical protein
VGAIVLLFFPIPKNLYGRKGLGRTNGDHRVYVLVKSFLLVEGIARYDVPKQVDLIDKILN